MKVLVTGGAGFIGSHIVDAYIKAGHEVAIVDDLSSGQQENINPKAEFYERDIRDAKIDELFAEHQFDVVIHHAAQMDVRKSVTDPKSDAEINILGTLNLLENCVKYKIKKFIFASTGGAVYGEQHTFPADEEHPTWPISPYGISKLCCEKYLYYYNEVHNLPYVIFRYSNVYGPRQNPHGEAGVVAIFTEKFLNGEQPTINGDGKQTRDYVYVGDLVRANLMVLDYPKNDVFNLGTGTETTVIQIYRHVNDLTQAHKEEGYGPAKVGEQIRSCLSYSKIERELGWLPEVSLKEGLQNTVLFFKNRC